MFLMRRAKIEDVSTLLKLAKMVHFINLPADKDIIADKALWSRQCFLKAATGGKPAGGKNAKADEFIRGIHRSAGPTHGSKGDDGHQGLREAVARSDLFMFALEDTESEGVLGTSQIITKMGGPGRPNVSLRLNRKEMFSKSLQMGATHMTAKLHLDETGPTEIGGLILQPSYRGHKAKLGRFLSLVRFHFMGLYRPFFSDRVIAELMGPVTPDGRNTLWEYLGRRFINLTYAEADSFCQYSKEFITALMPREEIYLTLLAPEARSVVATVGPETVPARRMLEKLGFEYKDLIDPFDGGPTLEAQTKDISLVRDTTRVVLGEPASVQTANAAIVSVLDEDGEFRALQVAYEFDAQGRLRLAKECLDVLGARPSMKVGFTAVAGAESATPAEAGVAANGKHARRSKTARKASRR